MLIRRLILVALFLALPHSLFAAISLGIVPTSSGGGGVFLTDLTMTDLSGSGWTNGPLTIGMPFATGTIDSSHSVQVVDQDTSTAILCDEPNRASDLTPSIRMEALRCIDPSGTSSEAKSLKAYLVSGAPATGTDISIAQIASAFTTASYDYPLTITNLNGVSGTWTASLLTALNSGNTSFVNTTTPWCVQYMGGGGIVSAYECWAPFVKSGTADAQMRGVFYIECYKPARGAHNSSTNPMKCRVEATTENAWIQENSPVDDYFGISFGTGGDVASFPNSTPSITLTLGATTGNNVSVTAASSLFTANSLGQVIANGTGVAVINAPPTDATHAQANIYTNFGSTTVGSGTYTLYGTNQWWGARLPLYTQWFIEGGGAAPNITSAIGDAWNGTSKTGGPFAYIAATKLIPNYVTSTLITNCGATDLSLLNAMGTNPMGYENGGSAGYGGNNGDIQLYLETSGEREDIGVIPDWDACALVYYDSNALTRVFGDANRWASFPVHWRDENTGLVTSPCNAGTAPTCSGNTNWTWCVGGGGTFIPTPANTINPWSCDAGAHDPNDFYIAYLLTGDMPYLEDQQFSGFYGWAGNDPNYSGTGLQKTVFTNSGNYSGSGGQVGYQERARTWQRQKISDATLFTPDTTPPNLGVSKTIWKDLLANEWVATNGGVTLYVDDATHFPTPGIRFTANNNNSYSSFETGYAVFELFDALGKGMLDSNGVSFLDWYAENEISAINDTTDVSPEEVAFSQYVPFQNTSSSCPGTYSGAWSAAYFDAAAFGIPGSYSNGVGFTYYSPLQGGRVPNTTLTLSGGSGSPYVGTNITATFGGGGYFAGGSFYVDQWIYTTDGGLAQITSVTNSNVVHVSTSASQQYYQGGNGCQTLTGVGFGSTSYTAGQVSVPMAAPGDSLGLEGPQLISSPPSDYLQIKQANNLLASQNGLSGGTSACTTSWDWTNSNAGCGVQPMSLEQGVKWVIH